MTTKEFIEKAKKKYGNKYTYEKTNYINIGTKVIVTDEHGNDKYVYPQYFLYKSKDKNIKKFNTENFIKYSKEIFGDDTYGYSKTQCNKSTDKVIITCKIHGDFIKSADVHIHQKQGCPKCNHKFLDTEKFIQKAKKIHGDKYDYSKVEYVDSQTKVCIICPEHGEFWQTPNSHLRGSGCPLCARYDSVKDFLNKSNLERRNIELAGDFINSSTKTKFRCLICNNEWEAFPYKITDGRGCPFCGHRGHGENGGYTREEWIKKAREIHGDKYDYSKVEYINCETPVCIICPKHGEFWQKPIRHLTSTGCVKCHETKLEKIVRVYCEKHNINYIYQANKNTFNWIEYQTLDFYLPDYNIAIECQGVQHFKPVNHFGGIKGFEYTINQDKIKYNKCIENKINIKYFTLTKFLNEKYFDKLYDNIEELLLN